MIEACPTPKASRAALLIAALVPLLANLTGCQSVPSGANPSRSTVDNRQLHRPAPTIHSTGRVPAPAEMRPASDASGPAKAIDTLDPPRFAFSQLTLSRLMGNGRRDKLLATRTNPDRRPSVVAAHYNPGGPGGGREVSIPGAQVAVCHYGTTTLNFWLIRRPILDATAIENVPQSHWPMVDVAITQCPDRLADALQLAIGPDFEARIAAAQAAERSRDAEQDSDNRSGFNAERAARARWKEGATVLPTTRVATLWQTVDRVLKAEEARGASIRERPASAVSAPTQAFATRMRRDLYPPLLELARSGFAQSRLLGAGEASRTAFDQWDRGGAGLAMTAIGRLQRLWPAGWWDVELVAAIEADLERVYTVQLRDKGLFDTAARGRVLHALERRRADAASHIDPPQALASTGSSTSTRLVFLRPGELTAYRIGQDIGKGLRGLGQAAGKAGQVRQMVIDLDKRLVATRRDFWSCWETHCTDVGGRWLDYSQALREKDWYHLNQEIIDTANQVIHGSRGTQVTEMFRALAGLREIDGGPLLSCEQPFDRLTARVQVFVQQKLMRNPFDFGAIASFSDELLVSPEQRDYQACRDTLEMAMRPRR
jgi:hypothetical protein